MTSMTVGRKGEMTLPIPLQERYGLRPETAVRIIEMRGGILLVPLTDAPPSEELAQEIQEWQALGQETLTSFAYEEETA
jgi:bifunctional DNA-binding transcriptional regulator/antitoxin component of YhaV-PrlF toxin-antitoxin module